MKPQDLSVSYVLTIFNSAISQLDMPLAMTEYMLHLWKGLLLPINNQIIILLKVFLRAWSKCSAFLFDL